MKSKDGHGFEFNTEAKNSYTAMMNALNRIEENGWGYYNYRIISIKLK
jgi:hypothetical protein